MKNQTTSQELKDDLLGFIQRKFYADDLTAFSKDKRRLLKWVVLYPATWLDERAVTIPDERQKEIFIKIMMLRYNRETPARFTIARPGSGR